jgi:ATP-grasp in the biosynthetic pathway with Ter operon
LPASMSKTDAGHSRVSVDPEFPLAAEFGGAAYIVDRIRALESSPRRLNVLMLCDVFNLPYRALRCLDAAGAAVHVLGGPRSSGFRFSRFCRSYRQSCYGFAAPCDGLSDEVNASIKELAIDLVLAGDHPATRTLLIIKPALSAPCFPMPALDQFELLNDKWSFTQLCRRMAIRCPRSELVADRAALIRCLAAGEITMPCIAKPIDFDGSRGVVLLTRRDDFDVLRTVDYQPILVQEYVEGDDIGCSVYCEHGKISAFIAHKLARATYSTFQSSAIQSEAAAIVEATEASGVLNFDMRITTDGVIYWLECNPRFFYKIFFSMQAGINFAAFGLPRSPPSLRRSLPTGTNVRCGKAIAAELWRPWRLTARDAAYLRSIWADPLPLIRESLHIDR